MREWFAQECLARGLDLVEDRAGNQWGWWGMPDQRPGVAIGSHLDSVPERGRLRRARSVSSARSPRWIRCGTAVSIRPSRSVS